MGEPGLRWATCPRFPNYEVSECGDLRRAGVGTRIKGYITCDGYIAYRIRGLDGARCEATAHTLVLEAFVGPRPSPTHQGAHCDGSRLNNSFANLRWATPSENQGDRARHGTNPAGERNGRAKICASDVRLIRSEYRRIKASGRSRSVTELEEKFGLHRATIVSIATGRSWRHIPMTKEGGMS